MAARQGKEVRSYRFHKASGQGIVTLGGRMVYLGKYGSEASRDEYERVIGEWLAKGQYLDGVESTDLFSVDDLIAGYWRHAEVYYRKDGKPTSEIGNQRQAMRFLHRLYGRTRAAEFGPLALKACRVAMIEKRLCRNTVNGYVSRIKQCFGWVVANSRLRSSGYAHSASFRRMAQDEIAAGGRESAAHSAERRATVGFKAS